MKQLIRILCVFSRLDRGGAETMCMNLYRNIDRDRIQFDFVKHTNDIGAYEQEILGLGGRIYAAPRFKGYNCFGYCKWWAEHMKKHPEHRVVHGHFFTMSAIYFSVAKRFKRTTIGHSHSSRPLEKNLKSCIKAWFQKRIERNSDYCFACSEAAGKWLFPNREFTVLNNAIDTNKFKFNEENRTVVRKEFGLADELLLGTVGNIAEVKNPFGLIDIFKEVRKHRPDAKLLWVGKKGDLCQRVEEKLKEEGLTDAVIMTGVRSDVDRLMQAMDVFIMPSLWEGLPVVLMEAQAAGLPCFISDTVTKEAAITDLCTFLPLHEPEKWADTILSADLTARRDTSQEIKAAGYDIKTTAKWLEDFYLNCLK